MNPPKEDFYRNKSEAVNSCLMALRQYILQTNQNLSETVKYGMPCFCLNKRAVCYLWTDKNSGNPYILFVEGGLLDFPELESGTRARMKIFPINPLQDIPVERLKEILNAAIAIYK